MLKKNPTKHKQQLSNPKVSKPDKDFPPSILLRPSAKNNKTRPQKTKLKANIIGQQ